MSSIFDNAKKELVEKVQKKTKKILAGALSLLLVVIICSGVLSGIISAVVGFISMCFSGFTNKIQKEAMYSTISSYGGAYKMLEEGLLNLEATGVDYKVIEELFKAEINSFDAYGSYITVPVLSYSEYQNYAKSTTNSEADKNADDGSHNTKLIWDQNEFTYAYRTNWQYLLAMATIMTLEDDEAVERAMEEIADKMNENGEVEGETSLSKLVTVDTVKKAEEMTYNSGKIDSKYELSTSIEYYTNYASDSTYANAGLGTAGRGQGGYGTGLSQNTLINSYDYSKYCRGAYFNTNNYPLVDSDNFTDGEYNYDGKIETADCFSYSYFPGSGKITDGNKDGMYAYVTYEGEVYPVCLIKNARNWLCEYSDFEYTKIKKDENNTYYICTTYTKTYNISKLIEQWKAYGIDESLYDFVYDIMAKLEDIVGGTTAKEFEIAYNFYMENGYDYKEVYTDPNYPPSAVDRDGTKDISDNTAFSSAVNKKAATVGELRTSLEAIWKEQNSSYSCSTSIGRRTAIALFDGNMSYEAHNNEVANSGYWCSRTCWENSYFYLPSYSSGHKTSTGWGSYIEDSVNNVNINEQIGLSSAGMIAYILRMSITSPYGSEDLFNNQYPSISEIYDASDYKFRDEEELRVGDLALLSPTDNDDSTNIIGYCIGKVSGDYVFVAMSPDGIKKYTLTSSTNNTYRKANFSYFCRYYRGWDGSNKVTLNEYGSEGSSINQELYAQYYYVYGKLMAYSYIYDGAVDSYRKDAAHKDLDLQGEFVSWIYQMDSSCSYSTEVLLHVSGGIMYKGVGDDRKSGVDFSNDAYDNLVNGGLQFPLKNKVGITSWYGWRPTFSSEWHDGMDFGTVDGTPVYPLAKGTIKTMSYTESSGYYLVINYGSGVESWYLHLSSFADGLNVGDTVGENLNEPVAYTGHSGSVNGVPYPSHFHFGLKDGQIHSGSDMYGLYRYFKDTPGCGERPANITKSVDPYLIFTDVLSTWPDYTGGETDGTRPSIEGSMSFFNH